MCDNKSLAMRAIDAHIQHLTSYTISSAKWAKNDKWRY